MATENKKYTVLVGCNYPPGDLRAEPGEVLDLPSDVARQLLRLHAVEPYKAPAKPKTTPAALSSTEVGTGVAQPAIGATAAPTGPVTAEGAGA